MMNINDYPGTVFPRASTQVVSDRSTFSSVVQHARNSVPAFKQLPDDLATYSRDNCREHPAEYKEEVKQLLGRH